MKTVREVLSYLSRTFQEANVENSEVQAEHLLGDLLGMNRMQLHDNSNRLLNADEWRMCQDRMVKRLEGMPLQYIHGEVEFYHCKIKVSPAVLIPRQETEILVDKIVQELTKEDLHGKVLWDVCCGSGCIGITLKKRFPELTVYLSDKSRDALNIAKENAALNQADVTFMEGDLLLPFQGLKADFLVCNPPYIDEDEFKELSHEVRDYEPKLALLGGKSGLDFYERLARELPQYLHDQAKIWFEIGFKQGEALLRIFSGDNWTRQKVEKDWAGLDRFFSSRFLLHKISSKIP